jgi:hypothetical protein
VILTAQVRHERPELLCVLLHASEQQVTRSFNVQRICTIKTEVEVRAVEAALEPAAQGLVRLTQQRGDHAAVGDVAAVGRLVLLVIELRHISGICETFRALLS